MELHEIVELLFLLLANSIIMDRSAKSFPLFLAVLCVLGYATNSLVEGEHVVVSVIIWSAYVPAVWWLRRTRILANLDE